MPAQEPVASIISRSKVRALLEPLRLEQAAHARRARRARRFSSSLMRLDRLLQRRARRDVVRVGVDLHEFEVARSSCR